MSRLIRVWASAPITPLELRLVALLAIEWWLMDHVWMIGTLRGWW